MIFSFNYRIKKYLYYYSYPVKNLYLIFSINKLFEKIICKIPNINKYSGRTYAVYLLKIGLLYIIFIYSKEIEKTLCGILNSIYFNEYKNDHLIFFHASSFILNKRLIILASSGIEGEGESHGKTRTLMNIHKTKKITLVSNDDLVIDTKKRDVLLFPEEIKTRFPANNECLFFLREEYSLFYYLMKKEKYSLKMDNNYIMIYLDRKIENKDILNVDVNSVFLKSIRRRRLKQFNRIEQGEYLNNNERFFCFIPLPEPLISITLNPEYYDYDLSDIIEQLFK